MLEALVFFCAVLAYLWFLVIPFPWTGLALLIAVALSWRRRSLGPAALGLHWSDFLHSFRAWGALWVLTVLLFVVLGYRTLWRWGTLQHGAIYFVWSAAQQVVFMSMTYLPLRRKLSSLTLAAALAGLAFALVHAPNPILVPATFLWAAVACGLFERCRSVWGLALLQTMLSSMLLWVTPPALHRNFRIGPYYFQSYTEKTPSRTFAPPIEAPRRER